MKHILVYGDSNSWGWVPGKMGLERFDEHTRWPGVMAAKLGRQYTVFEDTLGARTTNLDEPRLELPHRNGLALLPISLEIHAPVQTVIFMLGTADCKPLFDVTVAHITEGMRQLVTVARSFKQINGTSVERIIILAPPIIDDQTEFGQKVYTNSRQKTVELVSAYRDLATELTCEFLDSNTYVQVDSTEGIHITSASHSALGEAVANLIAERA